MSQRSIISEKGAPAASASACLQTKAQGSMGEALLVGVVLGCHTAPARPCCLCLRAPGAETRTGYNTGFRFFFIVTNFVVTGSFFFLNDFEQLI